MSDLQFGPKKSYEEYFIDFDFVNEIDDDDYIDSAIVTVMDGVDDVTDDLTDEASQTISGAKVSVWIKGGVSGTTYIITCQIVTATLVEKYESDADIEIL
jgi:hypothetical protein